MFVLGLAGAARFGFIRAALTPAAWLPCALKEVDMAGTMKKR